MFIDDMLIAEMKGVSFQVRPPEMRETVLTPDHPGQVLSGFSSVIDDGTELKMYYCTLGPNLVRLATSKDGVHWEKPELGIYRLPSSPTGSWQSIHDIAWSHVPGAGLRSRNGSRSRCQWTPSRLQVSTE